MASFRVCAVRDDQPDGISQASGRLAVIASDLPELEPYLPPRTAGDLVLSGVLIEGEGHPPVRAGRIRLRESEFRGVRIEAALGIAIED